MYVNEIVRLHGVLKAIIYYRDLIFKLKFRCAFQNALGIRIKMSSLFHPQTNEQTERTIVTLEYMLRVYALVTGRVGYTYQII